MRGSGRGSRAASSGWRMRRNRPRLHAAAGAGRALRGGGCTRTGQAATPAPIHRTRPSPEAVAAGPRDAPRRPARRPGNRRSGGRERPRQAACPCGAAPDMRDKAGRQRRHRQPRGADDAGADQHRHRRDGQPGEHRRGASGAPGIGAAKRGKTFGQTATCNSASTKGGPMTCPAGCLRDGDLERPAGRADGSARHRHGGDGRRHVAARRWLRARPVPTARPRRAGGGRPGAPARHRS